MNPALRDDRMYREKHSQPTGDLQSDPGKLPQAATKIRSILLSPRTAPALQPEPAQKPAEPQLSQSAVIPTVFHEDWWLDAATAGSYSFVEVRADNRTVGRLPFEVRRRSGLTGIWTPPLTHFLGPGIDDGDGSSINRFLRRLEITRELILKLPRSSWQCIRCHRGTGDVIAFQQEAFKTYAQFTYEVAPRPVQDLWQQLRDKTRNVIRRAQEQFTVAEFNDAEEFVRVYDQQLTARQIHNTLDLSAAKRVIHASLERNQGRIICARNRNGEIVAANFCAWDRTSSYYIACTRSEAAGNGASSLLVWQAMQHAAANGLIFDFAGLGTRGSVLHYAGFGGNVSTRFIAVRANGIGRLVARARLLLMDEHFLF
jgi:hypothetical protein